MPSAPGEVVDDILAEGGDAVFGQTSEEGPNYRNARRLDDLAMDDTLTNVKGWLDRDNSAHDEDTDRPRSARHSHDIRHAWHDTWYYLPMCNLWAELVVELSGRGLQEKTPGSLWH